MQEANVLIRDVQLADGLAQGGSGAIHPGVGGGGAGGFGGALFQKGGVVTLQNVILTNNRALGGNGGSWVSGFPPPTAAGASSGFTFGTGGSPSGDSCFGPDRIGPGGAGFGGGGGATFGGRGGDGAFAGGGGGGGGVYCESYHGIGIGGMFAGSGGFGDAVPSWGGGGGGGGLGGAIFVYEGNLTFRDCLVTGNSAFGGNGGTGYNGNYSGTAGQGVAGGLFIYGNSTVVATGTLLTNNTAPHSGSTAVNNPDVYGFITPIPSIFTNAIPGLYNTGVDDSGALLAGGVIDPHWKLVSSADATKPGPDAYVVSAGPIPPWLAQGPKSKWLSPQANAHLYNPPGNYHYRLQFNLTGFNPDRVQLTMRFVSDNSIPLVLLNGQDTGYRSGGLGGFSADQILLSGFVAGTNTLEVVVLNGGTGPNPTGFRAELNAVAERLPTAPQLLSFSSGGDFQLTFTNTSTASFTVFTSTNLFAPFSNWTFLGPATQIAPGQFQFTAPAVGNEPQRFFRVSQP